LTPPQWLGAELAQIQANRELPPIENQNHKIITCKELNTIFTKANLSVREFGNKLGLTHTMVHFLLKGKRLISKEVSERIEKFQKTLTAS